MKRILCVFFLVLLGLNLSAGSYDEILGDIYDTGKVDKINGVTVWAPKGILVSESQAYEYVAWISELFFFTWAGWDTPASSSRASQINSVQEVVGYWYDAEDEATYMVSMPRRDIVDKFDDEKYYDYDTDELYEEFEKFVWYYGDVSTF